MDTTSPHPHSVWRSGTASERDRSGVPDWYASPAEFGVEPGEEELVLWVGSGFVVVLSRRPYNPGHLHLVPRTGATSYRDLGSERRRDLGVLLERTIGWIERALDPDGINVGFASPVRRPAAEPADGPDESPSGGPFYVDVVPRWSGDTNFTVTVHGTRVLPESLGETYRRLRGEVPSPSSSSR